MTMTTCRKCGKTALEIGGYLVRVNATGDAGIWECKPNCKAKRSFEENILDALGHKENSDE